MPVAVPIGLGAAAAMAGHRVKYVLAAKLVDELVEAADERQLSKTIARYGRVDLLCLDELGHMELDRRGAELLFQVLTEREETNSIAIASNESFSGWTKTFTDPRLCAAIVDRLTFGGNIIETGTTSYRLAHARTQRAQHDVRSAPLDSSYRHEVLIAAGPARRLGGSPSRVSFGEEPKGPGTWAGRRLLSLDDKPAYELSFWCGTCQFLFQRLEGANDTLSLPALTQRLTEGLPDLDDSVINNFSVLLPEGVYLPLLLSIEPQMRLPAAPGDYFAEEQVATWGLDSFWGLPEHPRTAYYRTFETPVTEKAHLYEFVVPMLPPAWNNKTTVAEHAARLSESSSPTAVAVSTLDVCTPAVDTRSNDYYEHRGLTHFLLDGHHKLQAAAQTRRPLRLLSLLSIDASLASQEQLDRVPSLRGQPTAARRKQPSCGGLRGAN